MPDMEVACLLNPGVFRYEDKIWLVLRVAERPKQEEGKISFPVYNDKGKIEILSFQKDDTDLDAHTVQRQRLSYNAVAFTTGLFGGWDTFYGT